MNEEIDFLFYYKKIMDRVKSRSNEYLGNYGITFSQFGVMMYLYEHCNEVTTLKNLEGFFELSHVTLIGIIRRLESKEIVATAVNPDDKRSKIIMLRKKGIELCKNLIPPENYIYNRMISVLGEDKVKEINNMIHRIYDNFDKIFVAHYQNPGEELIND